MTENVIDQPINTSGMDMAFDEARSLRAEIGRELAQIKALGGDARDRSVAKQIQEDLGDVDEVMAQCTKVAKIPSPRMAAGAPGVVFLDGILRIIDGITEVLEMIIAGLKYYLKAARKIREMINKYKKWKEKQQEGAENEEDSFSLWAEAKGMWAEAVEAAKAEVEPMVKAMVEPIRRAAEQLEDEAAKAQMIAMANALQAASEAEKGSDYAVESAIDTLQGALAIAKAAYKMVAVVRRTISWIAAVLSVEPVIFLPQPICGWMIRNIYKWITGEQVPDLVEPIIQNVSRGNFDPVTIIQGVARTPTVREYIPNEAYEIPRMPFLGGGSVF